MVRFLVEKRLTSAMAPHSSRPERFPLSLCLDLLPVVHPFPCNHHVARTIDDSIVPFVVTVFIADRRSPELAVVGLPFHVYNSLVVVPLVVVFWEVPFPYPLAPNTDDSKKHHCAEQYPERPQRKIYSSVEYSLDGPDFSPKRLFHR